MWYGPAKLVMANGKIGPIAVRVGCKFVDGAVVSESE